MLNVWHKTVKTLCTAILPFSAANVAHAATVTSLDVRDNVATFTLSEVKTGSIPSCVANNYQQHWSLALNSESGSAMYALLMTAMASNANVQVQSAGDCAVKEGIERAEELNVTPAVNSPSMKTMQVFKPVAYGRYSRSDVYDYGACYVLRSLKNEIGQQYMTTSGNACNCNHGSLLVADGSRLGRGKYPGTETDYQCVIEVEIPVVAASQ